MKPFLLAIMLFVCLWAGPGAALKCQSDDGVTDDDVRRITRVCMKKIGDNTYDGSDYDNEDSGEYDDEETDDRPSRKRSQPEDEYTYRQRDHYRNVRQSFRRNAYYNDYEGNPRNGRGGGGAGNGEDRGDRQRNQNVSLTDKQAERDKACIIQCFFQEMKMTNDRGIPDKHKVIQVLTKDLRDKQLKEFYVNSIQECYYVLEIDHQRPAKCEFANLLIQCMAERARTNCDDWDNRTIIF